MTNVSLKGQKKEKLCADELQKEGWVIVFRSRRSRAGGNDFADLFDVVAFLYQNRKYISCKHEGSHNSHRGAIAKFRRTHAISPLPPGCSESFELWVWQKAKWCGSGKNRYWRRAGWDKEVL